MCQRTWTSLMCFKSHGSYRWCITTLIRRSVDSGFSMLKVFFWQILPLLTVIVALNFTIIEYRIKLQFLLCRLACNRVWIPRSDLSKNQTHAQQMCWRKKQLTCKEYVQVNLPIHSTLIIWRLFLTSLKFIYSKKTTKIFKNR